MADRFAGSRAQNQRAARTLAGGVATAFRASQQPVPICFVSGRGTRLTDIDGNTYVDWALGWGPLLLGHSPEVVLDAVRRQLDRGLGYGASHELEAELAEAVCRTVPSIDLCVFNSTGSEAVHAALRIARAATGRNRVIKFQGHYDGWYDPLHIGVSGKDIDAPGTAGQDPAASESVTVCPWNDLPALEVAIGPDVAAVIMEPVAMNAGCLVAPADYLTGVRKLVDRVGALLIFDEVITGYRLALGGAQEMLGVRPDLTVLGKALGGGFPISAVGGRADVMSEVASNRVAHVGTFNANPVCASAALAAVTELERTAATTYPRLAEVGRALAELLRTEAAEVGARLVVNQVGGVGYAFVGQGPMDTYADTLGNDAPAYRKFTGAMLEQGVQFMPKGLLYVSTVHGDEELDLTRQAVRQALATGVLDREEQ
ncbi:MAG: aspartate aminotransferase family protein [Actinomycetota bacterium]|nr:aspartate aminotransferase family protein [Actinomycetota bacterium]